LPTFFEDLILFSVVLDAYVPSHVFYDDRVHFWDLSR